MDPPWRNTQIELDYPTMTDEEISNLPVNRLQKQGYLFLWVTKGKLKKAFKMFDKWGYKPIDTIVWVKTKVSNSDEIEVNGGPGHHFDHSHEICLVGRKGQAITIGKK